MSEVSTKDTMVQNPIVQWEDFEPTYAENSSILHGKNSQQKTEADYEEKREDTHTLSFFETVAFTVNYVMGTGFLTIPWAFFQAGTALSLVTITLMVIPALLAILFVLESMARASVVIRDDSLFAATQKYQLIEKSERLRHWKGFIGLHNAKSNATSAKIDLLAIGTKKVEITELCDLFIGRYGKICYTFVLSICEYNIQCFCVKIIIFF